MASKSCSRSWDRISDYYSKQGVMLCKKRGGGDSLSEIPTWHVLSKGATTLEIGGLEQRLGRILTPSHKAFLRRWNGGIFFTQGSAGQESVGFTIYSTETLPIRHEEEITWLREMLDEIYDPEDEADHEDRQVCLSWIDTALVIGEEICSGNFLAIDYARKGEDGEYPLVFMDHETPLSYCEPSDQDPVVAQAVDALLLQAMDDPPEFLMNVLGGCAVYSDGESDQQWYPFEYKVSA